MISAAVYAGVLMVSPALFRRTIHSYGSEFLLFHYRRGIVFYTAGRLDIPATGRPEVSVAGCPDSELGALRFAPLSTPTPRRSTSSPPNQPVTSASPAPNSESANGNRPGFGGLGERNSQLTTNRNMTTTLPRPCHSPIVLALVSEGIASQSINPKSAAASPPMIPAAIIQKEISSHFPLPVPHPIQSKTTAVARSPKGNTIRIG